MNAITRDQFAQLLTERGIKKKLRNELKFTPETIDWSHYDFIAVFDKARRNGVLLYEDAAYPVSLSVTRPGSKGRLEPIICDICATWRRGSEAASLTFSKNDKQSVSFLVCGDLDCSLHVRGLTKTAALSRTQLREDIDATRRVERLHERLVRLLSRLG